LAQPVLTFILPGFGISLRIAFYDFQIEFVREKALWSHPKERLRCWIGSLMLTVILTQIIGFRDLVFHYTVSTYSRSWARRTHPKGQIE